MADQNEKVIARDREHLEQLIDEAIEKNGPNCDLNFIDVSNVTDLSRLFADCAFNGFNGNISQWNVSKVKNMSEMFHASQFNSDISKWDVSHVTDMDCMFRNSALEKNGNLPDWFKNSRWNNENKT